MRGEKDLLVCSNCETLNHRNGQEFKLSSESYFGDTHTYMTFILFTQHPSSGYDKT